MVSSTHHCAYTPILFTSWSTTSLIGKPYLAVCFTLICFQRLSLPSVATQRCPWRNNWYTIGLSNSVLSY